MKLGRVLLLILGIVALICVGLLVFTPKEVTITRTAEMDAPVEYVFEQVNDFKNWPGWMPWKDIDPDMNITYGDKTAGAGASYSWTSDKAGNGNQEILASKENESIETRVSFEGQGDAHGHWKFTPEGDKTNVSWGMTIDAGYNPIGRAFNLMMDRMLGKDFEKGLKYLNTEAKASYEKAMKEAKKEEAKMDAEDNMEAEEEESMD